MPSSSSWHPWSDFGRDQSHGPCPVIFRDLILNLDLARSNVRFEMPQDSPSLSTSLAGISPPARTCFKNSSVSMRCNVSSSLAIVSRMRRAVRSETPLQKNLAKDGEDGSGLISIPMLSAIGPKLFLV